ncbi:MAG: tetratricopeptide repeat protein [Pirellulales bacterium]
MLRGVALLVNTGCSRFRKSSEGRYETIGNVPVAQAEQAKKLNSDALRAARKGDWEKAETLLKEALESDINYAPAHNNLGQIYLRRHQLYLAAWEFEFAINLMPDRVEPYINLGLVYETAGQLEKAAEAYESALERSPDSRDALGCCARVAVKQDSDPGRATWLLEQEVMHDDRADWLGWAKELLATRYRHSVADPGTLPEIMRRQPGQRSESHEYLPEPIELNQLHSPKPSGMKEPGLSYPNSDGSSRQHELPVPNRIPDNPNAPQSNLQEASSLNLSRLGLPTVPANQFTFPTSDRVVPAGAEERK